MNNLIRKANLEDLDGILSLLYQLSPKDNSDKENDLEEVYGNILSNSDYYLNVCESDQNLSGSSMLFIQQNLSHEGRPVGHIENVIVDKNYRGKGLSKILLLDLVRVAEQRDCYKIILDCSEKSIPVYTSVGFTKTGEIQMRINL